MSKKATINAGDRVTYHGKPTMYLHPGKTYLASRKMAGFWTLTGDDGKMAGAVGARVITKAEP